VAGNGASNDRAPAQQVIENIGSRMRAAREELGMSIRDVAAATGLSTAMVSLVERGKASPSIGTIVSISDVLGLSMAGLFSTGPPPTSPVVRRDDQEVRATVDGMTRRLLVSEPALGIEISEHEYDPSGCSAPVATHHSGYECGLVMAGRLCVEVDGEKYLLRRGDAIHFPSSVPHRFSNTSRQRSRAVWFNVRTWPGVQPAD
jgi:transcriptional regulator with XRE-family HTH domain